MSKELTSAGRPQLSFVSVARRVLQDILAEWFVIYS